MSPVTVRLLDDQHEILAARRLHGCRYLEAGYVDRLDEGGVIDDPFVEISDYFGAIREDGEVLGVARLIPGARTELPVRDEFELHDLGRAALDAVPTSRVAEVSALAVARGCGAFKGGEVSKALYRAMYQYSLIVAGYTHWVAAIDVRVARHLVRSHGFLFENIGASRLYLGSETAPVILDLYAQMRHYALVDTRGGSYFSAGLVIDLRGDEPVLAGATGEFVPERSSMTA